VVIRGLATAIVAIPERKDDPTVESVGLPLSMLNGAVIRR
jgi:hypothetical protein